MSKSHMCSSCRGTGRLYDGSRCLLCAGTGYCDALSAASAFDLGIGALSVTGVTSTHVIDVDYTKIIRGVTVLLSEYAQGSAHPMNVEYWVRHLIDTHNAMKAAAADPASTPRTFAAILECPALNPHHLDEAGCPACHSLLGLLEAPTMLCTCFDAPGTCRRHKDQQ